MRILLYSLLIGCLAACQSTTRNLGEQFSPKNPISVDSLMQQLNTAGHLKDIQVEGKVEKSCMTEGCWFTVRDASGKEVLFNVKDKKFRVPVNSPGQTVILLADADLDSTVEQRSVLSVRGMHFK